MVKEWATEMLYIAELVSFKIANMLLHELMHWFVVTQAITEKSSKDENFQQSFQAQLFSH